jgi:4-aminobutyrate aminotransferase-like enzyme
VELERWAGTVSESGCEICGVSGAWRRSPASVTRRRQHWLKCERGWHGADRERVRAGDASADAQSRKNPTAHRAEPARLFAEVVSGTWGTAGTRPDYVQSFQAMLLACWPAYGD